MRQYCFFNLLHLDKKAQGLVFKSEKGLQNIAEMFSAQKRRRRRLNIPGPSGGPFLHEL